MSQQFDPTNRGVLFKNDRKTKDTQPGYTGTLNVEGVEYFFDAWVKDGNKGKFFSVSVKRKDKQAEQQAPRQAPRQQAAPQGGFADMDDSSIPF